MLSPIVDNDVTSLFETYRECARHLRNTYFSTRQSQDWEVIDDFEEVARVLFARLVIRHLAKSYAPATESAVEDHRFLIVPEAVRMPVMISRDKNGGCWDHRVEFLQPGDAKIAFRDYFDWDQHGLIDFRYYHGIILESETLPGIIGHEILIETIHGRIVFASGQTS